MDWGIVSIAEAKLIGKRGKTIKERFFGTTKGETERKRYDMNRKKLTSCEELVMKIVWDAAEELSLMDVVYRVNEIHHKAWKPQTVSTFLARLVSKQYLRHYRQGRVFYYQVLIPLEEYTARLTNDFVEIWGHGNADEFLKDLMRIRPLRAEEIEKIKILLVNESTKQWCNETIPIMQHQHKCR